MKNYNKKSILITGGAGFIGCHLVNQLDKDKYNIVILDRLVNNIELKQNRLNKFLNPADYIFYNTELDNVKKIKKIFYGHKPDIVCHLAAQTNLGIDSKLYNETNTMSTVGIFELAREFNVPKIVFASSSMVYGDSARIPFTETDSTDHPLSVYAATKKSDEVLAYTYHHLYGIKMIGLRFFTTYGPWGRPDMAISKFTEQIYRGEPITIHNHGKIRKDFSYITDTVSGIISAIETNLNFEIINLGSGTSTEIQKVIELIENNLEKTAKKEYIDMHFGDLPETRANIEKAKKLLNYKPKINIEEGIKRYIDWYKKYIIIIKLLNEAGRNFPVVIGGQMVSPTPEFAVEVTGADIGVIGEGEIILYNLVKALRNDNDISTVKGLVINKGKEKILTGLGEYIEDLSNLPQIPYELFPSTEWLSIGKLLVTAPQPHHQYANRSANIHGGRGCPFNCNFCYHHSRARCRPVKDILDDVKKLKKKFRVNHVTFDDDLAILSPRRAKELAEGMLKIKNLEYSTTIRMDILEKIDDETLMQMKKSGLRHLNIEVESGSQRILDIIDKRITVNQIINGFKRLKKVGILPNASIMIGQYTETNEDVQKSMDLMLQVIKIDKNVNWGCSITTPFPGSKLYSLCFEKGIFKNHYDFFHSLNKNQAMSGVTGNLSAMTDKEILDWKEKFKQVRKDERAKAVGKYVCKIETLRIRAQRFNTKLQEKYLDKLPKNIFGNTIKKHITIYMILCKLF